MAPDQALGPDLKSDSSGVAVRILTWLMSAMSALAQFQPFAQTKALQSSLNLLNPPNA